MKESIVLITPYSHNLRFLPPVITFPSITILTATLYIEWLSGLEIHYLKIISLDMLKPCVESFEFFFASLWFCDATTTEQNPFSNRRQIGQ